MRTRGSLRAGENTAAKPVGVVHSDALSSRDQLFDLCHPIVLPGDLRYKHNRSNSGPAKKNTSSHKHRDIYSPVGKSQDSGNFKINLNLFVLLILCGWKVCSGLISLQSLTNLKLRLSNDSSVSKRKRTSKNQRILTAKLRRNVPSTSLPS